MKHLNPFTRTMDEPQLEVDLEPSRIERFLTTLRWFTWIVAAKAPSLLNRCSKGTQMRATGTGTYLLTVTPFLAFIAMCQFLKPLQLGFFAFVFAAIWAVMVVIGDRLVLLFQTGATGKAKWAKAGFRFAGAAITGFLVTEALIVGFFSSSIDRAMRGRIDTQVAITEKKARTENAARKDELTAENQKLQERLDAFRDTRDEADRLRHAEADGLLGHPKGEDVNYTRRKESWQRASDEYEGQRAELEPKITLNDNAIRELEDNAKTRARLVQEAEEQSRDFLSQHQALFGIVISSPSAAMMYILMFLALAMAETAPLIQKVLSKPDDYDKMAADEEADLTEDMKVTAQMSRESIKLERAIWERVYKFIRDGQSALRDDETRLGQRIYASVISKLLERLFGNGRTADARTVRIVFAVQNHPQLELVVQLPKSAGEVVTLMDFNEELERITDQLPQNGHGRQQFLRAETSLGREIYVNECLIGQLESDGRVVLVYGHPLSYGATA